MGQEELSDQLRQMRFVEVGTDSDGAPLRVHRFTPVRIGHSGVFGVVNRVTEEVVAQGLESLSEAHAASTKLMTEAGLLPAASGMSL